MIRKLLSERLRNLRPSSHQHTLLLGDVLAKVLQRLEPTRPTNNSTVQAHGHHLGMTLLAFFIQHVECVLQVGVETVRVAEAGAGGVEFEVVDLVRSVCLTERLFGF